MEESVRLECVELARCSDEAVLPLRLTPAPCQPPSPLGFRAHTDSIVKTRLAKCVDTLQTRWPTALPRALLNLQPSALGLVNTPSEIITGRPRHRLLLAIHHQRRETHLV